MKIPKKKELLELQKKYRTDKKIGDVYGVPARLVAYWRSKKKIGTHTYPKYNDEKILELWERFGDDGKAGAELGISAAGFRQWRRRYSISKKPLQLRLEQLELDLVESNRKRNSKRETIVQKILAKKSGLKKVEIGQIVNVEPDLAMSHNNTGSVISEFNRMGGKKIWNPNKLVIVLDHRVPVESNEVMIEQRMVRDFARRHKVRNFYDVGEGICHQVVVENAHILPGQLALGTDLRTTSYGCLSALSTGISTMEMAAVWITGKMWMKVPPSIKIVINGILGRGVFAKDIILKLMRDIAGDTADYKVVEFFGSTVSAISISERFTLTSFAVIMGAKAAVVPFDEIVSRYLRKITKAKYTLARSDRDAEYHDEIEIDINYLTPQVASFRKENKVTPVEEVAGRKIDLVVLGSCSNGRVDDLEIAARILRGRRINRGLRMIVIPGSRRILSEAIDRGFLKTFVESGCVIVNPGCESCLSGRREALAPGERVLTTTGGNFQNRSGLSDSDIYVSSPATAAATALEGAIADPRRYMK